MGVQFIPKIIKNKVTDFFVLVLIKYHIAEEITKSMIFTTNFNLPMLIHTYEFTLLPQRTLKFATTV